MTLLGKVLVFFNLAFALLLAAWSFSLYANGIDWSNHKGKADDPGGQFAIKEKQLDELWQGVRPAEANWRSARRKLLDEESHRAADRVWYDNEMNHLRATADAAKPVGEIVVAAADDDKTGVRKGQVLLDDKGFPQLAPLKDRAGNPLESLAAYNAKDDKTLQAIKDVLMKHEGQIKEAAALTDLIIGDMNRRGFQQRIEDEKIKRAEVLAEQRLLKPLLVNTVVESSLILKRKNQLEKRIEELKTIGVASGK